MAYTEVLLNAWVEDNPNYNAFAGTASGKPLLYQTAANGAALLKTAASWKVWNYISEFPDLAQSPESGDISKTGSTARELIPLVPAAPSASELEVFLGQDTDATLDAFDALIASYQTAIAAGEKLFLCNFMGIDKRSEVYEANVSASGGIMGTFPDPLTKTLSVTPNLGGFHDDNFVITNVGG